VTTAAPIHREVERQKRLDANHGAGLGLLVTRVAAVARAQRALAERAEATPYELRQALVDLAAVAAD
jgi:hypothetical protein